MNIFILDQDVDACAKYHCDKHVVKMILETAQILCTVMHVNGIDAKYRPTHKNHPCVKWAGESLENFQWLRELGFALCREYTYRRGKAHKSFDVIKAASCHNLPSLGLLPFSLCMPEQYKVVGDPVASYRAYYAGEKSYMAKWSWGRAAPKWWLIAEGDTDHGS